MKIHPDATVARLEDLPNIGRSIAADLRALGIHTPADFARHRPLELYEQLTPILAHRHDPCILYTFLSVEHFQKSAEKLPWWKFTAEGKGMLGSR